MKLETVKVNGVIVNVGEEETADKFAGKAVEPKTEKSVTETAEADESKSKAKSK